MAGSHGNGGVRLLPHISMNQDTEITWGQGWSWGITFKDPRTLQYPSHHFPKGPLLPIREPAARDKTHHYITKLALMETVGQSSSVTGDSTSLPAPG